MSADHPNGKFVGELPQKSRRGRPPKPVTQARIASQSGVSRRTLARAKAHVEACERYPELATSRLAVDKQIALAKRLDVSRSSPLLAQYMLVEAIAHEIEVLTRKETRLRERYAEEWATFLKLRDDSAEDEEGQP